MAYFKPKGRLSNEQSAGQISLIIANSQTVYTGAAVSISAGFVIPATTTSKILGVVVGFVDRLGRPLDTTFMANKNFTGTFTNGALGTQNYVSSSSNQTVDMVKALIVIDPNQLYVNDTQTALTTAMLFGFFRIRSGVNATQLATYAGDVAAPFQLIQLDPDSTGTTTQGLFKIAQSAFEAYVQS